MKEKYKELFEILVKSYYEDEFEKTIKSLLNNTETNKSELCEVISMLCGVKVEFNENFSKNLKKAITTYSANNKIVEKLSRPCMCSSDGESPCMQICPFNAILKDPITKTSYINIDACTDCGLCVEACPNDNLMDKIQILPLAEILKKDEPVIAAVAPAISGQFGENVTMDQLRTAFIKMGFQDMVEVAFFADMLTIKEAVEFDRFVKSKNDLMITSCCCPMWVGMLKKVYEDLVKYVSPSISPMIAAGRCLKKLNSKCKVVFVGPCIAKKSEAKDKDLLGAIDFVLTFEELKNTFEALNIQPSQLAETPSIEYASKGGRLYARTGGVSMAVSDTVKEMFPQKHDMFTAIQCHGVPECRKILEDAKNGKIEANFIEGMGCVGGCVGGPKSVVSKEKGKIAVDEYAESSSYKVPTHSDIMMDILSRIGIESLEDFKNHDKIKIFERDF